jgi:hypothetical protein
MPLDEIRSGESIGASERRAIVARSHTAAQAARQSARDRKIIKKARYTVDELLLGISDGCGSGAIT